MSAAEQWDSLTARQLGLRADTKELFEKCSSQASKTLGNQAYTQRQLYRCVGTELQV